ncbi:hypothetical protein MD484_g4973, partial [Candolleomyces efflorescens]
MIQQLPPELWSRILHSAEDFTPEDFKTLCFVAHLFKTISQPLVYQRLGFKRAKVTQYSSTSNSGEWINSQDIDRWRSDVKGLIRADRRLCLVAGSASLSTFPSTISIGMAPEFGHRSVSAQQLSAIGKRGLSKATCNVFSQFTATLLRTLPLFTRLNRLEIHSFLIDDGMMQMLASHPTLHELKLAACSFSSPTFPLPFIRSLELHAASQEQALATLGLASQHLEELRIEHTAVSTIFKHLCSIPQSESPLANLNKLRSLTINHAHGQPGLDDMEHLLSYMPALRQLDLGDAFIDVPADSGVMNPSTIPCLQRYVGPLSFARYIIPGRRVNDIRCGDRQFGHHVKTWAELQEYLNPLCSTIGGAETVTCLHFSPHEVAPIWLLSPFVAEAFPKLVDLRLPVGLGEPSKTLRKPCACIRDDLRFLSGFGAVRYLEEENVEEMVKDIRDRVEMELVSGLDDPSHPANAINNNTESDTLRIPRPTWVPTPEVNVAVTLAGLCTDVVLDSAGMPSRHPKNYLEALAYFAKGWFPLPVNIRTLSLTPAPRPQQIPGVGAIDFHLTFFSPSSMRESGSRAAIVAALGERYPSLETVTFFGSEGPRYGRTTSWGNGKTRWSLYE